MSFYSDMAAMADSLLTQFGISENAVLRKESFRNGTDESPGTPINTDYPVIVVSKVKELDSVVGNVVGEKEAEIKIVASNQRSIIMSVKQPSGTILPVAPAVSDKLLFGTDIWNVDAAAPVAPGGITIIYKLDISQ